MSKHPPMVTGFYVFKGERRSGRQTIEMLHEVVAVVEVQVGQRKELAVAMTGRATKHPLSKFSGEWTRLELDEMYPVLAMV
jgi:hypothetical protein